MSAPTSTNSVILLGEITLKRLIPIQTIAQQVKRDPVGRFSLKARFGFATQLFDEFQKSYSSLKFDTADSKEDIEKVADITKQMDETYFGIKTIYDELLENVDTSVLSSNCGTLNTTKLSSVKLPKISLPTFDGNFKNWTSFIDLFTNLIHNNTSLSDAEKFQYLVTSLSREPLTLVKTLSVTDENYAIAFDTLKRRYGNNRLLATHYWNSIANLKPLTDNSVHSLRTLVDNFYEHVAALESITFPIDFHDFILLSLLLQKLDSSTRERFELEVSSSEIPTFFKLREFLLKQCNALETASCVKIEKTKSHSTCSFSAKQKPSSFVTSTSNNSNTSCLCCRNGFHTIVKCSKFLAKTPRQRFDFAKQNGLCIACLNRGHRLVNCSMAKTCKACSGRHHTLLHFSDNRSPSFSNSASNNKEGFDIAESKPNSGSPVLESNTSDCVQSFTNIVGSKITVLLSTALVDILDGRGNYQTVRVLLDSASQASFITAKCVNRLGLPKSPVSISVQGLNTTTCATAKGVAECSIRSGDPDRPPLKVDAIVLPKICVKTPHVSVPRMAWEHINNLKLADPSFGVPKEIDLLLGAELFPTIFQNGILAGKEGEPVALNTIFGWVLMGKVHCASPNSSLVSFATSVDFSLESTLKNFWELEEVPTVKSLSSEEIYCENVFAENHHRDTTGRYVVPLPFKELAPCFGDSYSLAYRRFMQLERRLRNDTSLRVAYNDFMLDYLNSRHMELVPKEMIDDISYYIPHHYVVKPQSTTTKLRVVFDASARPHKSMSSNDSLLTGPKLQQNLVTILLNFRIHAVAFVTDIKQMYRQILVDKIFRDYQRILFRFSPEDSIEVYRLNTVTYGVSSAPYLALRTLQQLARDEGRNFPLAAEILKASIFVDDVVCGCSSVEEARVIQQQLIELLSRGGFELRKWCSNSKDFLSLIPESHQQILSFDSDSIPNITVLGLRWDPSTDCFLYSGDAIFAGQRF